MVGDESSERGEKEKHSPLEPGSQRAFGELRHYVPQEILDVSFPVSVRGYERRAVDAYIKRVNRVIAELKVTASPPAAVRHALEQAEGKVQGLLRAAREAAEEITASAQQEADENKARAKAEAADLIVNTSAEADRVKAEADERVANARMKADETAAKAKAEADEMLADAGAKAQDTLERASAEAEEQRQRSQEQLQTQRREAETRRREIEADTEALWQERGELLEDIRATAGGLVDLANAAASRLPRGEPVGPKVLEPEAGDEPERPAVATSAPAPSTPAARSHQDGTTTRETVADRHLRMFS